MTPEQYEQRVQQLEAEGMTRSDAQGVADAEEMQPQPTEPRLSKHKREVVKRVTRLANERNPVIDRLEDRRRMAWDIERKAENGKVAVVYGGMDCDGGRWDNRVTLIPATLTHYRKWEDRYMDGAEGPMWWHVARPSDVEDLEPSSRDLALEAFEDGHPHVLYV